MTEEKPPEIEIEIELNIGKDTLAKLMSRPEGKRIAFLRMLTDKLLEGVQQNPLATSFQVVFREPE